MPTSERLREVAEGWEPRRRPVDVAEIVEGRTRTRSRGRLAVAAIAACGALVAGAAVVVLRDDGVSEPSQLDVVEDPPALEPYDWPELPPRVKAEWGSPVDLEPLDDGALVLSAPPWDGTIVADGPGGLTRVTNGGATADPLVEIEGASDLAISNGEAWVVAGGPERAVHIDPATGSVLEEIELPPSGVDASTTPAPLRAPVELGPLLVAPAADGVWVLRSYEVVTEVLRVGGPAGIESIGTIGGWARAAVTLPDGSLAIALGEAGLAIVPGSVAPGALPAAADVADMGSVLDVAMTDDGLWVAGTGPRGWSGPGDGVAVPVDPSTGAARTDPVGTGAAVGLIPGGPPAILRGDHIAGLPGLETVDLAEPGTRVARTIDGTIWSAGAWWIGTTQGRVHTLPGGSIAAPEIQSRSSQGPAALDYAVVVGPRGGRLGFDLVDSTTGRRMAIGLDPTIPLRADHPVFVQRSSLVSHCPRSDEPGIGAICPDAFEAPWSRTRIDAERELYVWGPGVDAPILRVGDHLVRLDGVQDLDDDAAGEVAMGVTVTTTPDGFPVVHSDDPRFRPEPDVFNVRFQNLMGADGVELWIRESCEAVQEEVGFPAGGRCIDGVQVAVTAGTWGSGGFGAGLANDILGTLDVRTTG